MTRENKLALVVGFGLVLFVGILISDHFSTARNQESADIRSGRLVDPLAQSRHDNATLLELPRSDQSTDDAAGRLAGPLAMSTGQLPNDEPESRNRSRDERPAPVPPRNEIPRIVMGGQNNVEGVQIGRPGAAVDFIFHQVQAGESLVAIARRYYGDGSLAGELARFNEIENPNAIRVGQRLRIPGAEALGGSGGTASSQASSDSSQQQATTVYTTYTVKRGDTLSEISQDQLGTARRWRELYELNKDVIRDPDNLTAGTELKIPRPGR